MVLFEYYNFTSKISPHFEAHESYVSTIKAEHCDKLASIPYNERCEYILAEKTCTEESNMINYMELMFCTLGPTSLGATIAASMFFVFIAILDFYLLSEIADKFFCPTLTVVSKYIHFNDVLAGTTLLALGNGSPDVITTLTQLNDQNSDLIYSELTGSCVFVTTIVTSCIILTNPFQIEAFHISRDILFIIFMILYVDCMIAYGLHLWKTISFFALYVCYVVIVVTDSILLKRRNMDTENSIEDTYDVKDHEPTIWSQLFGTFAPFTNMSPLDIVISPFMLIVHIICPKIDSTTPDHGWSKLLNCLQIIIAPAALVSYFIYSACYREHGCEELALTNGGYTLVLTVPLAVIAFFSTSHKRLPKFFIMFCFLSLVSSMFILFLLADELINILQVIGKITGLSEGYLGCTFLSYGFSVGDLVANTSFARRGKSAMALAACFAGPIFNVLLSLGIYGTYKCIKFEMGGPTPKLLQGDQGVNCTMFLILIQSLLLLSLTFTNFYARRSLACFLIISYVIYLSFITLSELEIIHSFGSEHLKFA